MNVITRALVSKWMEMLLHIHDTPQRTALAFAVGVFIGFSPFLGLHTVIAVGVAFLLNLNRVAVLIGAYANLPWFLPAWYGLTTAVGAWLLRVKLPSAFGDRITQLFSLSLFHIEFWRQVAHEMRPLFWPYFIGSALGAALLSVVAYWLMREALEVRRRHALEVKRKAKH